MKTATGTPRITEKWRMKNNERVWKQMDWSSFPAELVVQVWAYLVVWDETLFGRADMSTRWWPLWRQRYDQMVLHKLWDPCAMPRKLITWPRP